MMPLPHLPFRLRLVIRGLLLIFRSRIQHIQGVMQLQNMSSPYIVTANHTCYIEAIIFPVLIMFLRGGERIHFMADWSFLLNPFARPFFKLGQIIPVLNKPARPAFLNRFKHLVVGNKNGWALASDYLSTGKNVGIFPEGVAHGNLTSLRDFRNGTARLAILHNIPILPVGIRFPIAKKGRLGVLPVMSFHFGQPLIPTPDDTAQTIHQQLITHIAALSMKSLPSQV